MKKWLAIFLAFLCAIAIVIPAAADDTPTPTPTPTPVVTPTPTATPTATTAPPVAMSVNVAGGSPLYQNTGTGTIQCNTIEGGHYVATFNTGTSFVSRDFVCLGDMTVASNGTGEDQVYISELILEIRASSTGTIYYDADSQAEQGYWGVPETINPTYQGVTGTGEGTGTIMAGGTVSASGPGAFVDSNDTSQEYVYAHFSVTPPCDHDMQKVSSVGSGTIAATNETGVMEALTIGDYYELSVWGGPWNDGSADRYDTAVKVVNDSHAGDWTPLADLPTNLGYQCTQANPLEPGKTTIIFRAMDTNPGDIVYHWYIRVNDLDGEFADNTGGMEFSLDHVIVKNPIGCQNQYLQGKQIQGGAIDAKLSTGVHLSDHPIDNIGVWWAGNWIEIVTSGGPWQADGAPPDRYDLAIEVANGSWQELTGSPYAACSTTDGNYITAFYQLPTSNGIDLRVNYTGDNWNSNTGSMNYQIYAATYSPIPPTGCAEYFQRGDLIKYVTVNANTDKGANVGSLGNGGIDVTGIGGGEADLRYYAIETSGVWYDGTTPETGGSIAQGDATNTPPGNAAYSMLQNAPGVVCAVPLDPIGHYRVYMPLSLIINYWVRAQPFGVTNRNWQNYSGTMIFSIYKATNLRTPGYTPGTMPGETVCDATYTKGAAGPSYTIQANDSGGVTLPALTSGHVYAIETTGGPWSNNGVSSYEVAINSGLDPLWTNLSAYASAACAESADGNHILVYFQALAGRSYKFRVYDPGVDFTDNTGSMGLILYNNVVVTSNPWATCADQYTLTQITVPDPSIPITGINPPDWVGTPVTVALTPGNIYAIEIAPNSWWYYPTTPDQHYYKSDISLDNGSNWNIFGGELGAAGSAFGATCVLKTNQATTVEQSTYRVYFKAGNGVYKMRVDIKDVTAPFGFTEVIGGGLNYLLFSTTPVVTQYPIPPPPGNPTPPIPPGWVLDCYENYLRPNAFFENTVFQIPPFSFGSLGSITWPALNVPLPAINTWIDYLGASIRSYFAWCPQHTAALAAIPTTLNGYEPFGTISDVITIMHTLQTDVNAAGASGGQGQNYAPYSVLFGTGGGESGASSFQGILPVLQNDSPWIGGKLKWTPISLLSSGGGGATGGGESTSYYYYCLGIMQPHVGQGAAVGECAALSFAKTAPLFWTLLQLMADAGALFTLYRFVRAGWIDAGASG